MEKFIKFFGEAHLNYLNVALYQTDNGASAVCEHVVNGKTLGAKKFSSVEAAEDWWSGVEGRSAGKLGNAIDELDFASRAAG